MACREFDLSWKENGRDSFELGDNPHGNRNQKSATVELSVHNPSRTNTVLRRRDGERRPLQKANVQNESLKFHQTSLLDSIKTCSIHKDLPTGSLIHAHITDRGLLSHNISLGNALLSMYAKCGALAKAQEVFDELPSRNVVTWNALISAFALHGLGDEALGCLVKMQDEGLSPNAVTFICLLKSCGNLRAVEKIHAELGRQGLLEKDVILGTTLVDVYAKIGALSKAQGVFDKLPLRNVATWTALIDGYAQHGLGEEAICCYEKLRAEGLRPNAVTCICVLKACGSIGLLEKGEEIHDEANRQGLLENNKMLATALVDMYAKCGALAKAQRLFDKLQSRDVVTWNALIAGYAQHGLGEEALHCLDQMRIEGPSLNSISYICALKACSSIGAATKGEEIHAELDRLGLPGEDIVLGTVLVDMYANCGQLSKAEAVFNKLPARSLITWNALIAGYAQHGHDDEALSCYERMKCEGTSPDAVTFVCTMRACSNIGAIEKGEEIHVEVSRKGLLKKDSALGNALVDMHAKCGMLAKAQGVFDMLPSHEVVTWNALIAGYAQVGKDGTVFDLFVQMRQDGVEPDVVTFIILLTGCNHAGLVEDGLIFFNGMCNLYGIMPTLQHYACVVDIFGRAGQIDKAISVIENVPPSDRLLLWTALLSACQKSVNVELGRWVFMHAIQLDETSDATYTSMSNIYAGASEQEEEFEVKALLVGSCE